MVQNYNEQINKQHLYLRLPEMVASVVALILKDFDNTPFEAAMIFYKSSTFSNLEKWETGFWKKSPNELYENFLSSRKQKPQI